MRSVLLTYRSKDKFILLQEEYSTHHKVGFRIKMTHGNLDNSDTNRIKYFRSDRWDKLVNEKIATGYVIENPVGYNITSIKGSKHVNKHNYMDIINNNLDELKNKLDEIS